MIDVHTHLQDNRFESKLDEIILRAKQFGIQKAVCCGTNEDDWEKVLKIKERYSDFIISSLGVHPWYIDKCSNDWLKKLEDLIVINNCAVGEIGLDFAIKNYNQLQQINFFEKQLDLAIKYKRAVSIHCRKAWDILIRILEARKQESLKGIVHSYSGGVEYLDQILGYGLVISFSGSITYPRNEKAVKSLQTLPIEKIVLETDSPDILPFSCDGLNEPKNLDFVIKKAAQILKKTEQEVRDFSFYNGKKIFLSV